MLQAMRDRVMGVLGWIVIVLIIITFALFGLGSYLQNDARLFAAKVNGVEITPHELQLAYQNQRANLEQMLGDAFSPELIDEQAIKKQALENLIQRQLILQAAVDDGFEVSDQLLAARIHSIKAFQTDGEFDAQRYQEVLARQARPPAAFEHEMRLMLTGQQLTEGITSTAFVTDAEIDRVYSLQQQKRGFDYLLIAAEPLKADIEPEAADIEAYYSDNSAQFMTPERVRLAYVRLDADALGRDVEVSDERLREYYEQKKAALKTREQRRASHILFPVPADADQAAVEEIRARAEDVLEKIRAGADFAELAGEYSGDPGSADKGGDLGYFAPGAMVPGFDEAVFAMKEGEVSAPVRSQFGFHIIKLTGIRHSDIPSFAEMRDELASELKQTRVTDLYYEQIERLTNIAFENPDSLEPVSEALDLPVETTGWITAASGEGIGQYADVRSTAFSDDVLEYGNNSEPVEVAPNDAIVVRVADRQPAHPTPLEEVRDRIVASLKQQQAAQAAREAGEGILEQLAAGAKLSELASQEGYTFKQAQAVGRGAEDYNPQLVQEVFRLPRPEADQAVDKGIALSNGDYAVVRLTAVEDADPQTMTEAERTQLRQDIASMRSNLALATMLSELRERAEVEVPQDNDETP